MISDSQHRSDGSSATQPEQTFFSIPVGRLGWFSSLLIGMASGFAAFFAATFLAILTLLVLNSTGHTLDYALSYKRIGLPAGLFVGVVALGYLGALWVRRKLRRA